MTYEISPDGRTLTILATPVEATNLRTIRDEGGDFGTYRAEVECLEQLLANSELDWVDPVDTGDLTDAPMLGILGNDGMTREEVDAVECYGALQTGCWDGRDRFSPILQRWAFMSYQIRSFMSDLADDGKAVFTAE